MVELNITAPIEQPAEQMRYAQWLDWGTRLGLVVLVLTFFAYVLNWLSPRVPVHELPALWHLPVAEFTQRTGTPNGWAWLNHLQHGDRAGLLGIAAATALLVLTAGSLMGWWAVDHPQPSVILAGLAITGTFNWRASATVASMLTPVSMPSRPMSV